MWGCRPGASILLNGLARDANQEIGVPGFQLLLRSARRPEYYYGRISEASLHRNGLSLVATDFFRI